MQVQRRRFLEAAVLTPLLLQLAACTREKGAASASGKLAPVTPESLGFSTAGIAALNTAMHTQVDAGTLSGIVHMLVRHAKQVSFEAYGKKSLATGEALAKDALYRIHSQTKPVVAAAMMILYDEGKWQLDDPITKFLPEFAHLKVFKSLDAQGKPVLEDAHRPPTMQELMCHTAGFGYGVGGDSYPDERIFTEIWHDGRQVKMTFDEMLATLAKIPLLFQPGTDWKYSISADLQGVLIERLSGMSFPDFLTKRIFEPLKMADTGFLISAERAARLSSFYILDEKGAPVELKPTNEWIFPIDHTKPPSPFYSGGGGLVSTVPDFARFCQMLLNRGELDGMRILSPAAVDLMTKDQVPASITPKVQAAYGGEGQSFGFGMAILRDPARAQLKAPPGTVLWGGMGGTWFMLDRKNDLFFIGMVQRAAEVPADKNLPTVAANAVYEALVDPSK
jgi:CubicO group peptidase (beta-lactamase class C family)